MKLRLIIEKDGESNRYAAYYPELPGCASAGDSVDEAISNAKEALDLWFEPVEPPPPGARLVEVTV
jgi:predicted RNase H-like HicB family nuclease